METEKTVELESDVKKANVTINKLEEQTKKDSQMLLELEQEVNCHMYIYISIESSNDSEAAESTMVE